MSAEKLEAALAALRSAKTELTRLIVLVDEHRRAAESANVELADARGVAERLHSRLWELVPVGSPVPETLSWRPPS